MDDRFYRVQIKFINENSIIVVYERLNCFVDFVTEKERFVVEVNAYKHTDEMYKASRYKVQDKISQHPCALILDP